MGNTLLVCGYGPGISDATARRFAREGFQIALCARRSEHIERCATELRATGVRAQAFPCDLADPAAVRRLIDDVRKALGSITIIHWNAYAHAAGDLTRCDVAELRGVFDVTITGLVTAMQAALPDLREARGRSAILVTGGGYGLYDSALDAMAVKFGSMGLSLAKAAQHKLVGVLHAQLAPEGIFAGEVMVLGIVKGSAADRGRATIEASAVAERFFQLYSERTEHYAQVR